MDRTAGADARRARKLRDAKLSCLIPAPLPDGVSARAPMQAGAATTGSGQ